jgi:hypothetical protein
MSKNITKAELEQMLAAAQAKNQALSAENTKLRSAMSRRPSDALVISTNLVFQKGTHKDLVGKRLKITVPQEALGALFISGEVKENSNGNAYVWATGWVDTSKLRLVAEESSTSQKATRSFKDEVVDG